MELTSDEIRIITEYRKLGQSGKEDAISYVTSMAARLSTAASSETCRCSVKTAPSAQSQDQEVIITE